MAIKNKFLRLIVTVVMILLIACTSEKAIDETPSKEKPFCIEIKKERSYYQALKICNRLKDLNLNAYIVSESDTLDGSWFKIYSGALTLKDSLLSYQSQLEERLNIKNTVVVNILEKDTFCIVSANDTLQIKEHKRINVSPPQVDSAIYRTIEKYPNSNAFYNDRIQLYLINNKKSNIKFTQAPLDLPLGITKSDIIKEMKSFSEVKMIDNLSGSSITLQIMERNILSSAHASDSLSNKITNKHIEDFAQKIINKRDCRHQLEKINVGAYIPLNGFKLTIFLPKVKRYYYLLTDTEANYTYFCQSVDYSDQEIMLYLSQIGKSNGLSDYDEFYNTFYLNPSHLQPQDAFVGYSLYRLQWSYAKSKGYAKWSKEMVGHWGSTAYFYNTRKGFWTFGVYDLNSQEKNKYVEGLYVNYLGDNRKTVDVYGLTGNVIDKPISIWDRQTKVNEINFPIDRYVCMIDNNANYTLNLNDLVIRAERLQFMMDGYVKEIK